MKKLIKLILVLLNILVFIGLSAAFLSIYINPQDFWLFQFFGLGFIYIYIANIVFLIYWTLNRISKKMIILNTIFILFGISYFNDFLQINFTNTESEKSIKILSYNVRQFDLYNWEENKINRDKYFDFIRSENPDIVCFQEYYEDHTGNFITTDSIIEILGTKNYYFKPTYSTGKKYDFGIAIFSKYPILNSGFINFDNSSNIIIYSDLLIDLDTVRVFNAHLQSIKFEPEDYTFIQKIEESIDSVLIDDATPLLTKMRDAYKLRAIQADSLSDRINKSPYKVIVCGDFNDTPVSYTYHTVKGDLLDSFEESGFGIGQSYNGAFPSFRIDYILHSKSIKSLKYKCPRIPLSDHFPVLVYIEL